MMDDIMGVKIKEGDVVMYACRVGSKQQPVFAVVIDAIGDWNNKFRVTVRSIDTAGLHAKVYHTKPSVMINPTQVIVIPDTSWLPDLMLKRLQDCLELEQRAKQRKSKPSPTAGMTPGQRHAYALKLNREAGVYRGSEGAEAPTINENRNDFNLKAS